MSELRWTHLEQLLVKQGNEIVAKYRSQLDSYKKNATKTLYNDFTTFVKAEGSTLTLYGSLPFYWKYLEYGTRSKIGNPKGKLPPVNVIEEWIKVKPVTAIKPLKSGKMPSIRQLAWMIARHIQENGTRPYYFLTKSMPDGEQLNKEIAETVKADMADWIEETLNNIK